MLVLIQCTATCSKCSVLRSNWKGTYGARRNASLLLLHYDLSNKGCKFKNALKHRLLRFLVQSIVNFEGERFKAPNKGVSEQRVHWTCWQSVLYNKTTVKLQTHIQKTEKEGKTLNLDSISSLDWLGAQVWCYTLFIWGIHTELSWSRISLDVTSVPQLWSASIPAGSASAWLWAMLTRRSCVKIQLNAHSV